MRFIVTTAWCAIDVTDTATTLWSFATASLIHSPHTLTRTLFVTPFNGRLIHYRLYMLFWWYYIQCCSDFCIKLAPAALWSIRNDDCLAALLLLLLLQFRWFGLIYNVFYFNMCTFFLSTTNGFYGRFSFALSFFFVMIIVVGLALERIVYVIRVMRVRTYMRSVYSGIQSFRLLYS